MPEGMPYGKKQAPAKGDPGATHPARTEEALASGPSGRLGPVSSLGASRAPRTQEGEPEVKSGKSGAPSGNAKGSGNPY
jgi:hypothetical protein